MPLINCSACGNKISVEAEACPQCGHPNRQATCEPAGPKCYSCSAKASPPRSASHKRQRVESSRC
ncbi:MAG: zinc ribbon domain-containing protein [Pirellulaceae bacterium]